MNRTGKTIAWVCIFSTLFVGCYSSALIDPKGEEKDKIYSDQIQFVVTNDGTKYEFDTPPTITKNAIVGMVKAKEVSIPLSEVSEVEVRSPNTTGTVLAVIGIGAMVALVITAVAIHDAVDTITH